MKDGQLHQVMTGCGYRYTRARNLPEKSILHSRELQDITRKNTRLMPVILMLHW